MKFLIIIESNIKSKSMKSIYFEYIIKQVQAYGKNFELIIAVDHLLVYF